ncbi:MAG: type ISP restriction/modification enzyme, partial [Pseudomonadota bacterium]
GKSEGWLGELMDAYKKEPGGKQKLQERNSKLLNDLYVKFIRMSEHMIEKNGEGVLGFITNHGYLDNVTFRGMRWHLLKTFDKIYVLDLHGNAKKSEVAPDGSADKNVFDIQQGVAIIIGVKKRGEKAEGKLAQVFHGDLWGARKAKYEMLLASERGGFEWAELEFRGSNHEFVDIDWAKKQAYESGLWLPELMPIFSLGTLSKRDALVVADTKDNLKTKIEHFFDLNISTEAACSEFGIPVADKDKWDAEAVRNFLSVSDVHDTILPLLYRPFDFRYFVYHDDLIARTNRKTTGQVAKDGNLGLVICRQPAQASFDSADSYLCTDHISDQNIYRRGSGTVFPIFTVPDELHQTRRVNFDPKLYAKMRKLAGLGEESDAAAEAVFDYIYGVLHCPAYRETYAEFLKIDFPRIPWPSGPDMFEDIRAKGNTLRRLHLMEPEAIGEARYPLHGEGDNVVAAGYPKFEPSFDAAQDEVGPNDETAPSSPTLLPKSGEGGERREDTAQYAPPSPGRGRGTEGEGAEHAIGRVYINNTQYFDGAAEVSWSFWIGGYQPAQKWLKDRRGRALSTEDLIHYQRVLKILGETDCIMKTIDMDL